MAKKRNPEVVQTRWGIKGRTLQKVAVYKSLHGLTSVEEAANILLEKSTIDIKLPG